MATTLSTLRSQARRVLLETSADHWTDASLLVNLIDGVNDLWTAIVDLNLNYFITEDATNVSLAADGTSLTGVPADVFKVVALEPRDLTTSDGSARFLPRDFNHPDFVYARSISQSQAPAGAIIYFDIFNAGAPTGTAPTIRVAPAINTSLNLRLLYVPTPAALTASSNNPIPGNADQALVEYALAFALAEEREDRSPDPNHLEVYKTLKEALLTSLTPRQTVEPETVDGVFDDFMQTW